MENKNEKKFNTLLKIAVEESVKQEMDEMPSREGLDKIYKPSKKMKRRFKRMLNEIDHSRKALENL